MALAIVSMGMRLTRRPNTNSNGQWTSSIVNMEQVLRPPTTEYTHFLMTMGHLEERSAGGRRGLDLDPLDLANNEHQGWHYLFLRRYDESIDLLQKAIELDTTSVPGPISVWPRSNAARATRPSPSSTTRCASPARSAVDARSSSVTPTRCAGRRMKPRPCWKRLRTLSKASLRVLVRCRRDLFGARPQDEASEDSRRAYGERDGWMDYLGVDPRLDGLQPDPRFSDLMRHMKLNP